MFDILFGVKLTGGSSRAVPNRQHSKSENTISYLHRDFIVIIPKSDCCPGLHICTRSRINLVEHPNQAYVFPPAIPEW